MLTADELYEIMIHLNGHDLQALCSTSTLYNGLCQNADFWKNKLYSDDLPIFNNPSSLNDYLKIKQAHDIQLTYESKSYATFTFTDEDLSIILPKHNYDQIKIFDYDQVELYLYFYKNGNIPFTINYKATKGTKRVELKVMKLSREEIMNVIFKIAYYYPHIIK